MLKYKLIKPLEACTIEEINKAFDYMDEWAENSDTEFTLEMLWDIFPQFSGSESEIILESWRAAQPFDIPPL